MTNNYDMWSVFNLNYVDLTVSWDSLTIVMVRWRTEQNGVEC